MDGGPSNVSRMKLVLNTTNVCLVDHLIINDFRKTGSHIVTRIFIPKATYCKLSFYQSQTATASQKYFSQ